jgi:hypothetical protein
MKVIVAGFSRSGIHSMQAALEALGYRGYNFYEMMRNFEKGHMDMWNDFMEGKGKMDWNFIYDGYDASLDIPSCIYWREQMEAFPDARVILTVRDLDAWWNSWSNAVSSQEQSVISLGYLPRFAAVRRMVINWEKNFFRIEPGKYVAEDTKARIHEHNEAVKATVPPERLLVFNFQDGWEPLCKFLGFPVPDEPFPHEHAGVAAIEEAMGKMVMEDMQKYGPPPQQS